MKTNNLMVMVVLVFSVILMGCEEQVAEESVQAVDGVADNEVAVESKKEEVTTIDKISEDLKDVEKTDGEFLEYENPELGFKMKYPKKVWISSTWNRCEEDDKGRFKNPPERLEVPLSFFVKGSNVYVAEEYYFEKGKNGECNKIENNIDLVIENYKKTSAGWKMTFADIAGDDALEDFVKKQYGQGCGVSGKKETKQEGVYDVEVYDETGEGMITGECALNYLHVLKYAPSQKKAIQWNIGQDRNFANNSNESFDGVMTDSFEFMEEGQSSNDTETKMDKTSADLMNELLLLNGASEGSLDNYKIFEEVKSPDSKKTVVLFGLDLDKTKECCSEPTALFINNDGVLGNSEMLVGALQHLYLDNVKWVDNENITYDYVVADEGGINRTEKFLSIYLKKFTKTDGDFVYYENPESGVKLKYPKEVDLGKLIAVDNARGFTIFTEDYKHKLQFDVYDTTVFGLEEFVQMAFGNDCKTSPTVVFESVNSDVFTINGGGGTLDEVRNCSMSGFGFYSEKYKKLVTLGARHDCEFEVDGSCVEDDIVNSLEFIGGDMEEENNDLSLTEEATLACLTFNYPEGWGFKREEGFEDFESSINLCPLSDDGNCVFGEQAIVIRSYKLNECSGDNECKKQKMNEFYEDFKNTGRITKEYENRHLPKLGVNALHFDLTESVATPSYLFRSDGGVFLVFSRNFTDNDKELMDEFLDNMMCEF